MPGNGPHPSLLTALRSRWAPYAGVALLIAAWWIAAAAVGRDILLPSPSTVAHSLVHIVRSPRFAVIVRTSVTRWGIGFLAAFAAATVVAAAASRREWAAGMLRPLIVTMRSTPVIAIILLALIWLSVDGVPIFVSLLVAFPLIYQGVLDGLRSVDPDLLHMGRIYHIAPLRRVRHIHIPSALPVALSAITSAVGMSWKAAVAAEVLSQPSYGIGTDMQIARLYLETSQVVGWTVVAVGLAALGDLAVWAIDRRANAWRTFNSHAVERRAAVAPNPETAATDPETGAGPVPNSTAPKAALGASQGGVRVVVDRISFSFPDTPLFSEFSLEIPSGGLTAVLGRSGSGKTTLLRLIARDLRPDSGEIRFESEPLTARAEAALRQSRPVVGFVFQEPRLLPWRSVLQNVELVFPHDSTANGARSRRTQLRRFLRSLRLPRPDALPSTLSGGMRHRVNLARGFLCGAPVICLDEPFSSQDPATRNELVQLTRRLKHDLKRTVVMVSHDPDEAFTLADIIVVLEDHHPTSILRRFDLRQSGPAERETIRSLVSALLQTGEGIRGSL